MHFTRTILRRGKAKPLGYTDASGWGFGAFVPAENRPGKETKSLYIREEWTMAEKEAIGDLRRKSDPDERWRVTMETCEGFGLLALVDTLKKALSGGNWIVNVDNEILRSGCTSGRAKRNDWTGIIIRELWSLRAEFYFGLVINRVSTGKNTEADCFSRGDGLPVVQRLLRDAGAAPLEQVYPEEEIRNFFVRSKAEVDTGEIVRAGESNRQKSRR